MSIENKFEKIMGEYENYFNDQYPDNKFAGIGIISSTTIVGSLAIRLFNLIVEKDNNIGTIAGIGIPSMEVGAFTSYLVNIFTEINGLKKRNNVCLTEFVESSIGLGLTEIYSQDPLDYLIGCSSTLLGKLATTYPVYLAEMCDQALEESEYAELLKQSGNIEPSKKGHYRTTESILDPLQEGIKQNCYTNLLGLNGGMRANVGNFISRKTLFPYSLKAIEDRTAKLIKKAYI